MSSYEDPYPSRRPLAAAADAVLTVVVAPELISADDAESLVAELQAAGLPVEVADEASLSRRAAELIVLIHLVLANREALEFMVGVLAAGTWEAVSKAFGRLTGKAGKEHEISIKVDFKGESHLVGTAVGEVEAAKLIEGLPAVLYALKEAPVQDPE
jgi:hypothetical protein